MTVGERIRNRRMELGMTQEELAFKLGYKSRSSVNKVELSNDLTLKTVRAYAKALSIDPLKLMGLQEEDQGKYSHVDSAAVAEIILDPDSHKIVVEMNSLNREEKKELLSYARYLKNKREG